MINNSRILAIAIAAALIGGSLGAIAMRSSESSSPASPVAATSNALDTANPAEARDAKYTEATYNATATQPVPTELKTTEQQDAYKIGFADGFEQTCNNRSGGAGSRMGTRNVSGSTRNVSGSTRNVSGSTRNVSPASSSRTYYSHNQRNGRTFWQKHRDKLTMAMGTGGGALIGALAGGKKGAAIGSVAGLGGSALYTYKIRKRNRR